MWGRARVSGLGVATGAGIDTGVGAGAGSGAGAGPGPGGAPSLSDHDVGYYRVFIPARVPTAPSPSPSHYPTGRRLEGPS
ncbi:hypothetical protein CVT25_004055 [Psilocybe cyanescens]|uniref:Uncharacterized protein n=1 Tax=Psilocybe cyanescens TaxID=93625 RepID=A0A409WXT1_PSICY|nr:hypothetical protein CVT25_004055 [Psilocybe cyanescens]